MTKAAGAFEGLDRFEARKRIVAALTEQGLIDRVEDKEIALPRCYRCDTIVEPYLSKQWFVKMRPLLEPAAAAVREGRVKFVPERYARTYFDWVEQYRDWCISRQLWWGHRIPVYTSSTGTVVASEDAAQSGAGGELDPGPRRARHVVLGAALALRDARLAREDGRRRPLLPDRRPRDGARHHLLLGRAHGDVRPRLPGKEPFHTVYITGTVLDEIGRRMSKSLGNGIDPVEMIDEVRRRTPSATRSSC